MPQTNAQTSTLRRHADPHRLDGIRKLEQAIRTSSGLWDRARERAEDLRNRIANPAKPLAPRIAEAAMRHWLILAALVGAVVFEFLTSGRAFEDLVARLIPDATWGSFVGPLAILAIEMGVAHLIAAHRSAHIPGTPAWSKWHGIGVALFILMVAFSASAQIALLSDADGQFQLIASSVGEALAFVLMAAVSHSFVLGSGAQQEEAFAYFRAGVQRLRHQAQEAHSTRVAGQSSDNAIGQFRRYHDELEAWERDHGYRIEPSFDRSTIERVNTIHGYKVIELPPGQDSAPHSSSVPPPPASAAEAPPNPPPETPPPAGEDAQTEYYRRMADQFVRREEEQVRP